MALDFDILADDLRRTMRLLGATTIGDLDRSLLRSRPARDEGL